MKPNLSIVPPSKAPSGVDDFIANVERELAVFEAKETYNLMTARHAVAELHGMVLEASMGLPQRAIRAADADNTIADLVAALKTARATIKGLAPEMELNKIDAAIRRGERA